MIAAKGGLIRKALGVDELTVEVTADMVSFPWFVGQPTPEEIKAYEHLICALCNMACNQRNVIVYFDNSPLFHNRFNKPLNNYCDLGAGSGFLWCKYALTSSYDDICSLAV